MTIETSDKIRSNKEVAASVLLKGGEVGLFINNPRVGHEFWAGNYVGGSGQFLNIRENALFGDTKAIRTASVFALLTKEGRIITNFSSISEYLNDLKMKKSVISIRIDGELECFCTIKKMDAYGATIISCGIARGVDIEVPRECIVWSEEARGFLVELHGSKSPHTVKKLKGNNTGKNAG